MRAARQDGLKRRDALLDAALSCFRERGVLGTGIEDIRKAAGASPSSVYNLFDGLHDVTLALLTRTFERLFAHLARRVTAENSAEKSVMALVDGHLEWVMSHRDEARFMYEAMSLELGSREADHLQNRKGEMLVPIVQHFVQFMAAGALPSWPALMLDVVLLGTSHEACRRWLAGAELDPAWMRATLPVLAWKSLATEPKRPTEPTLRSAKRGS